MKNINNNFDIADRARRSIFIDRQGDWTSYTDGMGSMAEYLGTYTPEFLIFVEIFDCRGELILNYPVERRDEDDLEEAMKRQVIMYGKLLENVGVSTVAVETLLVESAEWFAFEHFDWPEFLIVEVIERAERKAEPNNQQLSYLDLIAEFENQKAGIETTNASKRKTPIPKLCEQLADFEVIALPVIMRAKSIQTKPIDDNREVDADHNEANSSGKSEPSTEAGAASAVPDGSRNSTFAKASPERLAGSCYYYGKLSTDFIHWFPGYC